MTRHMQSTTAYKLAAALALAAAFVIVWLNVGASWLFRSAARES